MNRSVSVLLPSQSFPTDQSDHAFWVRIGRELGVDVPDHLIALRPWRWLNSHHHPPSASHSAQVLQFPTRASRSPQPEGLKESHHDA